jgi:DNA-binding NtrC family response regulator
MSKFASLFLDKDETGQQDSPAVSTPASATEYKLLFVDDETGVLKAMQRIFHLENYKIFTAPSGQQALSVLESENIQVVVSDHRMPGMTGTELLQEVKKRWPKTIRIMLTGYADVEAVMGAVNDGAVYKFITKPWNDDDLRLTVSLALEQYEKTDRHPESRNQAPEPFFNHTPQSVGQFAAARWLHHQGESGQSPAHPGAGA